MLRKGEKLKEFEELDQLKKAMMEEKDKPVETEKKDDHLSRICAIATRIEHNVGVYLQAAYIDTGSILDVRLKDIYISYINTIVNFLRIFEGIEGDKKEEAVREAVIKLRFGLLEVVNNLVKPILKKYEESKEYPTKNIDTFKNEWNSRITEFKEVAEKFYDTLDIKRLFV